jgi:hypothetical protein
VQESLILLLSSQGWHARAQRRFWFVGTFKHPRWQLLSVLGPFSGRRLEDFTHLDLKRIAIRGPRNVFHMPSAILHVAGFETRKVPELGPAVGDHRGLKGGSLRNLLRQILCSPLITCHHAQEKASDDNSAFSHGSLSDCFLPLRQAVIGTGHQTWKHYEEQRKNNLACAYPPRQAGAGVPSPRFTLSTPRPNPLGYRMPVWVSKAEQ